MKRTELDTIIEKHKLWLDDQPGGKRANLKCANLRDADFTGADLKCADLKCANLKCADLTGADLTGADITGANLTEADFTGANLDFASWPLWCGSLKAYVDDRITIQLLYHTLSVVQHSPYVSQEIKEALLTDGNVDIANRFRRVAECGRLRAYANT